MNILQPMNGIKRILLLVGLALTAMSPAAAQTNYVFMYNNFIFGQTTSVSTDFIPNNCVYTGTSGSTFRNGNGYYIVYANNSVSFNQASGSNLTINNNYLYYDNTYYLRYSQSGGSWQFRNQYNVQAVAYVVTTSSHINDFSVSGDATISATGTNSSYSHTNANYYDIYSFNNLTYYSTNPSAAASTTAPTSGLPTLTTGYTWSISSNSYATVNATTGAITVNSLPATDQNVTLTCSATRNGVTQTATKTITIEAPKPDPTGISITSGNTMTAYVGNTSNITYSLTPSPCYNNVTFSSANTGIAMVNGSGVVTGVATGTTTITVTALKIDGSTTSALTKTVSVTVKDKVATPVIAFTPTVADAGATATAEITCSTTGTAIYYTVNGSDPTSSSTQYNGTFSVNDGDIVKAIAIKTTDATYWDNSDIATRTYTACSTTAPVITYAQSGSSATVTITAETGATIYYTTNGNNPTTSSTSGTTTVTIPGVASGATVKAFAKNGNCQASSIVSKEIITSGVSGGVVTLYDYEDHTWTYYSGVDASVDGGNYNTTYLGKLYSPNPRNVKITYKANGGAVSISESETEFVYYKTLEEGTTSGQYPYQVISNPFSKRPNGKGFGGWKIKEGADYISGYNDEAILPLDAEIVFTNLPYPSVNCTSAEIELEATWVNYNNRTYASGNTFTYSVSGGTYETNFLVLNRNVTGTITVSSPCTIMMVEPDGSTDYRGSYTFSGNITPNNNGVTKIEWTKWQSNNTVTAGYRNLWIGRGVAATGNDNCAALINGGNTTSTASPKFHVKVESGKYNYMSLLSGYYTYTGGNGGTGFAITGSETNAKITLGNDYDRAKGTNTNLQFVYGITMGRSGSFSTRGNRDNLHTLDLTIKSGRIGYTFFMENTNTANYLQGGAGYCMYISSGGSQTNMGTRNVIVEGGDMCTLGSGVDSYNNAPSNNDNPSTTTNYNRLAFNVRIKGGTIHGNVYGGAAKSPSGGNRVMIMTGGHVKGWFAAGCNGTDNDGGQNYGTSWVYIGGNAQVNSEGSTKVLGYANGGNVYAAGAGRQGAATCGEMTFGSNLVVADNSYIERGIYGGGNYGYALASTNIYITGGINGGIDGTVNTVTTKGGVYGGANQQDGPGINLYMTGGEMRGGVYGGCNTQGTISASVAMKINGGQVGTSSSPANIHGGGYGSATRVSQNVDITLGEAGQTEPGVTVYGDVYGGSALGYVNGTAATNTYHTNVTLNKGTINGSLYGGGLGDNSNAANVYGPVQVKVYGGSVNKTDANGANGSGGVYGANNVNGAPQRSVTVDIYGTDPAPAADAYALYSVYGGGNQADYTYGNGYPTVKVHNCDNSIGYVYGGGNAAAVAATDVTIYGGNKIGNVFGGGNGTVTAADVTGDAVTKIYGGTIGKVFGGSNSQGTIGGTISVTVDKQGDTDPAGQSTACDMKIGELYGGGNEAASQAGSISIGCTGDITADHRAVGADNGTTPPSAIGHTLEGIGDVYGGANNALVTGDITLNINSGMIYRVFGGNNTGNTVSGTITVNVAQGAATCGWYVGYVYGGGNNASYSNEGEAFPAVNHSAGKVTYNVYGGGKGYTATVTSNPKVILSGTAQVGGNVFGGGNAAPVVGNPTVLLKD